MGITVTSVIPRAQRISHDLYLHIDLIEASSYNVAEGGFLYDLNGITTPKKVIIEPINDGRLFQYAPATGKIQVFNPAGSHTHAVALDSGASAGPSGVANFPGQSSLDAFLAAPSASATKYFGPGGTEAASAAAARGFIATKAGFLRAMYADLITAPGADKTYTLTVNINGVDSAMTISITGTNKTGSDEVHNDIAIAAGDRIVFKSVNDNGAAAGVSIGVLVELTAGVIGVPAAAHTHAAGSLADAASGAGTGTTPAEVTGSLSFSVLVTTIGYR